MVRGAKGGLLVNAHGPSAALPQLADIRQLGLDPALGHYLGRIDADDCFALDAGELTAPEPWSVQGLRSLYGQLDEEASSPDGASLSGGGYIDAMLNDDMTEVAREIESTG